MKNKNIFLSFLLACSIIIGFPFTAYAEGSSEQSIIESSDSNPEQILDTSFIKSSNVKIVEESNNNFNITITDAASQYQTNENKEEFTTQSITFLSMQNKEKK